MKKYCYLKRFFDIVMSYSMLLILYLPMLLIAAAIYFFDGSPVIFKQIRVGKNRRKFVCYKFRTMRNDAPRNLSTEEFTDANKYITPLGAFLRKTSLDELPQLFNVLAGEMSIVGPRPLIPEEEKIHEMRNSCGAYSIRPGMTGLAQVCGRDVLTDVRKAECDILYAQNMNLLTDARIIIHTISSPSTDTRL